MQAIIDADYSYTPAEYWSSVSNSARAFIDRCLTVDPHARQTAHQALQHPWLRESADAAAGAEKKAEAGEKVEKGADLLPMVRKNFNARVKLHAAIDTIRAINQLRAGQGVAGAAAKMMDGAKSKEPGHVDAKKLAAEAAPVPEAMEGVEGTGQLGQQDDRMEVDQPQR
jgi:calcium/calmodulin-dependent protein kinase I